MIYVHPENNNGNLIFDSVAIVFIRGWYMVNAKDAWLLVPAISRNGRLILINKNVESAASIICDTDGQTQKVCGGLNVKLPLSLINRAYAEAISIPEYEKTNGAWDYNIMFDKHSVQERHKKLLSKSSDSLYLEVMRHITPKPCNCGKLVTQ